MTRVFQPKLTALAAALILVQALPCAANAQADTGTETTAQIPGGQDQVRPPPPTAGLPEFSPECLRYDKLQTRATAIMLNTPTCATVSPEWGGVRSALADNGIGVSVLFSPRLSYDVLGHDQTPVLYSGQRPQVVGVFTATATYDLNRLGFPGDSQFTFEFAGSRANYELAAPNTNYMKIMAINQRFFSGQLELQYGYYALMDQFYGVSLGGNGSMAAFGPASVIPVEVGMSMSAPTPSVDVTLRDPSKRWYGHFSVSRSVSPKGIDEDIQQNPSGFALHVDGARPIYVGELGYKTEPFMPGNRYIWIRAGGIYNTSSYQDITAPGKSHVNYGGYLGATYQLTQPDGFGPRGLNVELKTAMASKEVNLFTKDYSLSFFYIGPFESRRDDMVALSFSRSTFNDRLRKALPVGSAAFSSAISFSYAAKISRGIYSITTVTHQTNPTFTPLQPKALIFQQMLTFSF